MILPVNYSNFNIELRTELIPSRWTILNQEDLWNPSSGKYYVTLLSTVDADQDGVTDDYVSVAILHANYSSFPANTPVVTDLLITPEDPEIEPRVLSLQWVIG